MRPLLCLLVLALPGARASDAKKGPLPKSATWELGAFRTLFTVAGTRYDEGARQVRWTLRTREALRTFDLTRALDRDRPFVFLFYDGAGKELARVDLRAADFKGIPKTRVTKEGTPLELTLDLPRTWPKVKKVVLKRGKVD
jgi:hypothetical protein